MPRVVHIKSAEEFAAKLGEKKSFGEATGVVVDFTASWCGPCKMIGPYFDQLSDEYTNITFLKVDVDECNEVASQAGVRAMPTFQTYLGGAKEDELVGADKGKLKSMIDSLVAKAGTGTAGVGRKLGGSEPAAAAAGAGGSSSAAAAAGGEDTPEARRARMAAAAEARFKAQAPQ